MKMLLRQGGVPLALLLVAVLAFKILYQIDHGANNPVAHRPVSDERLYMKTAARIAGGELSSGEVFHQAPLYPYLLAPVFLVCGEDPLAARLVQALIGTASVLIFYLLARFFFNRPYALIAAAALALYYPFSFFEGKLLIATSTVFFTLLCLMFLVWQCRLPGWWAAGVAGFFAGIAAALRPNLLLFIPLIVPWFLCRFKGQGPIRRVLLFLGAAALAILPFTLHNALVENDFVLLSDNGGLNFFLGNNPAAKGSFQVIDPVWGDIEYQHTVAKGIAEMELGHALKPSEVSGYWFRKGLSFISENPGSYLHLLFMKGKSFLENYEYAILYSPGAEREMTASLRIPCIPFAAYLFGAIFGLVRLFAGSRKKERKGLGAEPDQPNTGAWPPLLILLAVILLSVFLFFNYSRFRLIALPSLILLGVYGLGEGLRLGREKEWPRLFFALCLAGVFLVLSLVPYGEQWALQSAHGFSTIGDAFGGEGYFESAERYYSKALDIRPDLDIIQVKRGRVRVELGDFEGAKKDLEAAVRERPRIPGHLAALAGFFARKSPFRDLNRALAMIQTASGMAMNTPAEKAGILMIEGNIRMERGEFPAAAKTYESAFKASPGPESADTLFLAGTAWNAAGQPVKARAFFEEVLHWKPDHRGALSALGKFGG